MSTDSNGASEQHKESKDEKFAAERMFNKAHPFVNISILNSNFIEWFPLDGAKSERLDSGRKLRCHKLQIEELSLNDTLEALGGEVGAEISLLELLSFMEEQENCNPDAQFRTFCSFIRDKNGVIRLVKVWLSSCGWRVEAGDINNRFYALRSGSYVLSRN